MLRNRNNRKTARPALIGLAVVLALLVIAGARALGQAVTGTFVPIEVPGATFTAARGITADGRIVGFYRDASGRQHGFLLADGAFTTIDPPVEEWRATVAAGINARGDIVGAYVDRDGVQHGYVWPSDGPFRSIDVPGATLTLARSINEAGDIAGFYDTSIPNQRHGFLLSRAGVLALIDLPNAHGPVPNGTYATSVNDRGHIVGPFFDGTSIHGFHMAGDVVTQIDAPFPGAVNTQAWGLNAQGDIVGYYTLGGRFVAYRRDRHGNFESLDAPTATPAATLAFGISAAGDIVGQYTHMGVTRGFVMYRTRTP